MRYKMPIALMILSLTLTGWSAAQSANDADAGIKTLNQSYEKAVKAADVSAMANLWADDGVMLPPGEPAVVGSRQIRAWLSRNQPENSQAQISNVSANWRDITVAGDYAFQWAPTFVNIRSADNTAGVHMSGTALQVLKKQPDGSWKLYRSSWSYQPRKKDASSAQRF